MRFTRPLVLLVLASASWSCRSTTEWRDEADREAYELVRSRREALALGSGNFSIEPDRGTLRGRLDRGEAQIDASVSLVRCLEIAAENSREYQTQKERLFLAALDLTLERWRFTLQKGGTIASEVRGTGDEAESVSADGSGSLSQLLGSGAKIVGGLGLGIARSLVSSDDWAPTSDLSLSVTQPLLAGFGRRIVEEPLTQAERDLVYEVRAFERFRRTFALDVASRYYRLVQLEDEVKNQENNVKNLEQLTARNRALAEAGRLSDIEVGQARQNELRSQNQLLSQRQRLEDSRDQFKLFIGLPIDCPLPLDPGVLAEIEAGRDARVDFAEEQVVAVALRERLDHQTALDRVDDAARGIDVAEDELQGVLDLRADARLASTPGKPLEFDPSETSWSVGFDFSLPFERLPQRNAYRRALVTYERTLRDSVDSADTIRSAVRSDLRTAANRRDSYEIQAMAVELAERRIDSTRLKLDAGRADTRDLLEAQESLLEAQNALTSALIDYTLERLNLFLDMELLRFGPDGIQLEESILTAAATPASGGSDERAAAAGGAMPAGDAAPTESSDPGTTSRADGSGS